MNTKLYLELDFGVPGGVLAVDGPATGDAGRATVAVVAPSSSGVVSTMAGGGSGNCGLSGESGAGESGAGESGAGESGAAAGESGATESGAGGAPSAAGAGPGGAPSAAGAGAGWPRSLADFLTPGR